MATDSGLKHLQTAIPSTAENAKANQYVTFKKIIEAYK